MQRQIEISWNHGNVDLALERARVVVEEGAGDDRVVQAADDLCQAFSQLFASEGKATHQAELMFGEGIGEVRELVSMRSHIWGLLEKLKGSEDRRSTLVDLRRAFDAYRNAEWSFIRSYGGLMTPGAEGS